MKIRTKEEIKKFKEKHGYDDTDQTIAQSSKIIDFWLGAWIKSLAIKKGGVNIEQKSDGVIELQNENGEPNCMIYEDPLKGFIFTKAAIPIGSEHPASKTKAEMEMAFKYAEDREKYTQKALRFYELRYIYYFLFIF